MTTLKELRALCDVNSQYMYTARFVQEIVDGMYPLLNLVEQAKIAMEHYQHADGISLPAREWLKQLKEFEAQP